jgi:hypothetical protein
MVKRDRGRKNSTKIKERNGYSSIIKSTISKIYISLHRVIKGEEKLWVAFFIYLPILMLITNIGQSLIGVVFLNFKQVYDDIFSIIFGILAMSSKYFVIIKCYKNTKYKNIGWILLICFSCITLFVFYHCIRILIKIFLHYPY